MKQLLLISVLIISACGGGGKQKWSGTAEADFLLACEDSGGPSEFCICGLRELESRFSEEEMRALSLDELSAAVVDTVEVCD